MRYRQKKINLVHTTHVSGANLSAVDDVKGRAGDVVGKVVEAVQGLVISEGTILFIGTDVPKVPEHHGRGENHGGRVGTVRAHDVLCNVTASRLKECKFLDIRMMSLEMLHQTERNTHAADVATRHDTGSTDEGSTDV